MKKSLTIIFILMICFGITSISFADELSELKLKALNMQLEYRYLQERQKVLTYESQSLEKQIKNIEDKRVEEQKKKVENKKIKK